MEEKISVCIPVFNGGSTILQTIDSILSQSFKDFEIVVVDNASTDNTIDLVKSIKDERIKIYKNEKNIGCGRNLDECKKKATGDILFYICADDIADVNAIKKVYDVFKISDDIGIVARPYYWFSNNFNIPVRATKQFDKIQIISINDSYEKIRDVISLSDQISGIAFRQKYIRYSFGHDPFIEMAGLVVPMLKSYKAAILPDNIVAIRINTSGSMNPFVYRLPPVVSWANLINFSFCEDKHKGLKRFLIDNFIANNHIGLVQIKNFSGFKALFREIYCLIRLKWRNIFVPKFWFFSLGTIVVPKYLLKKMVVFYKDKVNSSVLKHIKYINYQGGVV